ncbi:MAG: methyltransferase domain-containing protein [Candidatus Aureabacteria bacterium]|nr:methyltransferase domain-containing protein [Candidatus Auribacterota bacterium]
MDILLLNPPFIGKYSRTSRSPAVTKGGTIYYPFWLAYAAGVLEKNGHTVRLIDAPADGLTNENVREALRDFRPQLIVLDTSTPSIYDDVRSGEFFKLCYPDSFMVLVGTHPSALPEETMGLSPSVDAVARGEYDFTLRDLAAALRDDTALSDVRGISYREEGRIRHCPPMPLIEDMDSIPFVTSVYKKHLNIRNYRFAAARHPMVMIITGRGCPYRCSFCVYPQTFHSRKYRPRSAENVVDEFEYVRKNLPWVKEIGIEDDTFTADKARCEKICDLLIERGSKIPWYCNARADIDYTLLKKMREAGCRLMPVGFESASQEILNNIHKGIKADRMLQFVGDARRAGILIHGCLMIGNPGESEETARQSFDFALKAGCDSMQFYPLFVYPGTEAYEWARGHGYLTTTNYREWLDEGGDYRCVIDLPGLPGDRIVELCKSFYVHYHLRLSYIFKKLCQGIAHPAEGVRTVRSAMTFINFTIRDRLRARKRVRPEPSGSREHGWDTYWGRERHVEKFSKINTSYREVVDTLMNLTTPRSRCIELGCGSGTYAIELASKGRDCIGSDYSPSALRITRAKAKSLYGIDITLAGADIYTIPFKDGSFDMVFSDGVIEHLEVPKALEEMKRILKPGGVMVAKVPSRSFLQALVYYGMSPFMNRPFEAWYPMERWVQFTKEAGFTDVKAGKCGSIIDGILMRVFKGTRFRLSPKLGRLYYLFWGYAPRDSKRNK